MTVRDGEVAEARGLDRSGRQVVRQSPDSVPTIGDLLEELDLARREDADQADAEYTADGRPERITLDWRREALDDEAAYEITAYEPTP